MKKLLSIILALVMMLTLCTATVMAVEGEEENPVTTSAENTEPTPEPDPNPNPPATTTPTTGTITVTNAQWGVKYSAYRILDLKGGKPDNNGNFTAYSYKVSDEWLGFFYEKDADGSFTSTLTATAAKYFDVAEGGFITANSTFKNDNSDVVIAFAEEALEYAKTLAPTDEKTAPAKPEGATATSTSVEFKDLPLGYYLIDSNLGALCALDTTNPKVNIREKNQKPVLDKTVEKTDGSYGKENTATIGKIFNYRIEITNVKGAQDYVVYDRLSSGITYLPYDEGQVINTENKLSNSSVNVIDEDEEILVLVVKSISESGVYNAVKANPTTDYTFTYTSEENPVKDANGNDYSFKIVFTEDFLNDLSEGESIVIYYRARLNEEAEIGDNGNPNDAKLEYSKEFETDESRTTTKTWWFDVLKYTEIETNVLSGAEFKLRVADTKYEGGFYYYHFTKVADRDGIPTYRVCYDGDDNSTPMEHDDNKATKRYDSITTDETGKFRIIGLRGNSTFELEEVKAPDGYNKLVKPTKVTIKSDGTVEGEADKTVKVENKTGSEMPSTGSAGTKAFCIFGGLTMIISCVFLVTKKKMSVYED